MYNPVEIAEITEKTVCENNRRRYYRFRPARFYGGISTADCVGCCLRCEKVKTPLLHRSQTRQNTPRADMKKEAVLYEKLEDKKSGAIPAREDA